MGFSVDVFGVFAWFSTAWYPIILLGVLGFVNGLVHSDKPCLGDHEGNDSSNQTGYAKYNNGYDDTYAWYPGLFITKRNAVLVNTFV